MRRRDHLAWTHESAPTELAISAIGHVALTAIDLLAYGHEERELVDIGGIAVYDCSTRGSYAPGHHAPGHHARDCERP